MITGSRTADLDAIDYFMDTVDHRDPLDVQIAHLAEAVRHELNSNPVQGNDGIVLAARYVAYVLLSEDGCDDASILRRLDEFVQCFEVMVD